MTVCAKIAVLRITLLFVSGGIFPIVKSKKKRAEKTPRLYGSVVGELTFSALKGRIFALIHLQDNT